jgi:hypothetical protein
MATLLRVYREQLDMFQHELDTEQIKSNIRQDYSKLVAVLNYVRECRMPLPPPYKQYAEYWEAIAREEVVTA